MIKAVYLSGMVVFALGVPTAALAQIDGERVPAPIDADEVSSLPPGETYTPADFVQFAPRTAREMIAQISGFSIKGNEEQRGLGQATGNVLFNGKRSTSKSESLDTLLGRIPAGNVIRIEIVDGATLDLPGLFGQVANVIYRADGFSGQFAWRPQLRKNYAAPQFTRGDISVSGRMGAVQYQLGLDNSTVSRTGARGFNVLTGADGALIDRRDETVKVYRDTPRVTGNFTLERSDGSVGHVNLQYQHAYERSYETGLRSGPGFSDRLRTLRIRNTDRSYELGGDYEFALLGGNLKLIGIERFSREPFNQTIITRFADGRADQGDRLREIARLGERIGRGEYSWKMLGGDWQAAAEAAFNRLDKVAVLERIDATSGNFAEVPFPDGSGSVDESRYEGSISVSRPIAADLSAQMVFGGEVSTLTQNGPLGQTRQFLRPRGSASLAWRASLDLELSAKLRRRVGQLSFLDFLAQTFLNDDNQNAGNANLRPQQDWELELEAKRKLGAWGSTTLRLSGSAIDDYVDLIPSGTTGEAVGNISSARELRAQIVSTLRFDPVGWTGAKLDLDLTLRDTSLRDPFTGARRPFSDRTHTVIKSEFRRDLQVSHWAWGATLEYADRNLVFRRNQVDRTADRPGNVSGFVEHKDLLGMTMRLGLNNPWGARQYRDRVIFTGVRDQSAIAVIERRDRDVGPNLYFTARGTF